MDAMDAMERIDILRKYLFRLLPIGKNTSADQAIVDFDAIVQEIADKDARIAELEKQIEHMGNDFIHGH